MYSETFRLDNNTINLIGDLDYETLSFYQYHIVAKVNINHIRCINLIGMFKKGTEKSLSEAIYFTIVYC